MTPVSRYHSLLVALHWFLALFIVAALVLGALVMAKMSNADPMKLEALRSHMIGGSLILALMLLRLLVRQTTHHPMPATTHNHYLDLLKKAVTPLLYISVFGQALSGLGMAIEADLPGVLFFGHGSLPSDFWALPLRPVHYVFSRVLMALIALHVSGALYHIVFLKDGLLGRMGFGRRHPAIDPATPQPGS